MEVALDPKLLFDESDDIGQQEVPESDTEESEAVEEVDSENAEEAGEDQEGTENAETEESAESGEADDSTAEDAEGESSAEADVFEINGQEYTLDALNEHIAELERGSLRQSDYTKKTQELSVKRKAIEANVQFVEALKSNDLMDSVKEALVDAGVDAKLVDSVVSGDLYEHPDTTELQQLREQLETVQAEREAEVELDNMVKSLSESKSISIEEANNVRKFAEELYEQKGTLVDLEDAYDLYRVRKGKVTVTRKQPSLPKTPRPTSGGKPQKGVTDHMDEDQLFID